ncbi:MAG: aldehyde dehydrogenase family protein, partial [Terriglobus roseus]|nr:aldehyde dehydrogenase family protein [Terriglobus roseus]
MNADPVQGMASWKLGPALACGNTVVLKPSEETPLSILLVATLIPKAGFPPGVINIINGTGAVAGQALAAHMDVDKIAFTGSTATGRLIMKAAATNLKSITLETGGKSPLLVFDDADLEQAARWAHLGIMSNQGQICTATSRILVQRSILDRFLAQFRTEVTDRSIVGHPFTDGVFQGPQVSRRQYERVLSCIARAREQGAHCFLGGNPHTAARTPQGDKGFF